MIEVLQPGLLTTIQDAGRRGYERYGVPRSGTFDPFLAAIANKLVGNSGVEALLEFAFTGPDLHFHQESTVALSGFGIEYEIDGAAASNFRAFLIPEGSVLSFTRMQGWFGYLAIAGGFEAERVLGSVSTYVAGQIGKRLQKNDILRTGPATDECFSLQPGYLTFPQEEGVLTILGAQHTSRFSDVEREKMTGQRYRIHPQSNRMGIRLDGASIEPPLIRHSAPALPGTVQIPQSGSPIILGPEGPTTGGYAQIGVLSRISWTVLAATRPGKSIRFEWNDPQTANRMWVDREKLLHTTSAWQPLP